MSNPCWKICAPGTPRCKTKIVIACSSCYPTSNTPIPNQKSQSVLLCIAPFGTASGTPLDVADAVTVSEPECDAVEIVETVRTGSKDLVEVDIWLGVKLDFAVPDACFDVDVPNGRNCVLTLESVLTLVLEVVTSAVELATAEDDAIVLPPAALAMPEG